MKYRQQGGHIVIVGQWREGHARLPLPYAEAIVSAGGHPAIFSAFYLMPSEQTPEGIEVHYGVDVDDTAPLDGAIGLIVPGGGDIDPTLYGRDRHPRTHNVSERRDHFELTLLTEALDRDMPVLAICHGMQLLNVKLGGTLDQNVADTPGRVDHDVGKPCPGPIHRLRVKPDSRLAEIFGATELGVNSHHHQGLDDVSVELEEVGWAEDGVLEAVESRAHRWVIGVQWHPEVMVPGDVYQARLFDAFVAATESYAAAEPAEIRSA